MRKKQIKLTPLIILIALTLAFLIGSSQRAAPPAPSEPQAATGISAAIATKAPATTAPTKAARPTASPRPGEKQAVADYLAEHGELPDYYLSKAEARDLGWSDGSLERYAPGKLIGGDRFGNFEGLLPKKSGRVYYECDIDTLEKDSRGAKRIVFSNDGLIFYTDDHYESFTKLAGGD